MPVEAEHARLIQQGVQSALLQLAQLLADALLVAAVPGQAGAGICKRRDRKFAQVVTVQLQVPSTVTSLPAVAYWAMPFLGTHEARLRILLTRCHALSHTFEAP